MVNGVKGVKKSNFVDSGVTAIPGTATLDYVSAGVNLKVSFTNFLAQLGTTGSIVQDGAVTGVPVLDKSGTINNIRNLEPDNSLAISISPENGITMSWNATFDQTGVPLTPLATASPIVMRSLVAGTGIGIAASGDTVVVTATGVTVPTDTIIINQESDFPVQDASTITLNGGKIYKIGASFSTAKAFVLETGAAQGVVMSAENQFGPLVTYTGTGDMFTGDKTNFIIRDIRITSPSANQTFNMSDTAVSSLIFFRFERVFMLASPAFGTFTSIATQQFTNSSSPACDLGPVIAGTGQVIVAINEFALFSTSTSFVYFDLGAIVAPNIEFRNPIAAGGAGSIGIKGAAASANVPANLLATVAAGNFDGVTTPLSGIVQDDIRWKFLGNSGIEDTVVDALVYMNANATVTTISTINTPVKVAGTFTVEREAHFLCDTTGKCAFLDEIGIPIPIGITVLAAPSSGGSKNFTVYLARNGSVITASGIPATAASGTPVQVVIPWQRDLVSADEFEIFIENNSDAQDFLVSTARLLAN